MIVMILVSFVDLSSSFAIKRRLSTTTCQALQVVSLGMLGGEGLGNDFLDSSQREMMVLGAKASSTAASYIH